MGFASFHEPLANVASDLYMLEGVFSLEESVPVGTSIIIDALSNMRDMVIALYI